MELEEITEQLNKDQTEIEDKIIGALNQLEDLESASIGVISDKNDDTAIQDDEISADSSVSEEHDIVETESSESEETVDYSETDVMTESDEEEVDTEVALGENEEDNQSELQERITEDPQDGLPMDDDEETVEEDEVPTVDSEFGEMPEDEMVNENKSKTDLFEQSLDIF
jgi:hypothetical protein